jgi:acetylornithine/succinyldiaminopimelate/putrescine aminotransferase
VGAYLKAGLEQLAGKYPGVILNVRGLGMMLGIELASNITAFSGEGKSVAVRFTNLLHEAGLLAVPTATHIIRFLPALNLRRSEADEGLKILRSVVEKLSS